MKLTVGNDTHRFHRGHTYVEVEPGSPRFQLRRATRLERARLWLHDRWRSATRWWRPRTVCSAVDPEAGSITLVTERWSWRRWRWERIECDTADKPSIAELQRIEREDLAPAPWESLDHWTPSDRGKIALRNAAPALLEIAAAAMALLEAGMCDHANCEEGCASGDAWNALAAAAGKVRT